MSKSVVILVIIIVLIIAGVFTYLIINDMHKNKANLKANITSPTISANIAKNLTDDWCYTHNDYLYEKYENFSMSKNSGGIAADGAAASMAKQDIGFSVGGAKDANNFRENIKDGYFPISTDITYNGIFYDYFFETNKNEETSNNLFYPSYSLAYSPDPISGQKEYYMTVGLNSNIKESDFQRKKLNLVVVLDISGSMSSGFDTYYYDFNQNKDNKSKMKIANEAVNTLIDNLNDDDRLGIVLFDDDAYVAKPLNLIANTDIEAIKGHVLEITARGGTNFEAGYKKANEILNDIETYDANVYENRIIVITDAMPNTGMIRREDILGMVKDNSEKNIYTTFIGVGVDFNTNVIEKISDAKGANYYSVHSSDEFMKRMGEEFEFMVTPLVFDLNLDISSTDFEVEKVYGTDTQNNLEGNILHVNTLFPSKSDENGEIKGGVILIKLKELTDFDEGNINISVSYKDRSGKKFTDEKTVKVNGAKSEETYDDKGIRKAIVLTRYVNTIKNWILYERSEDKKFAIMPATGIIDCDYKAEEIYVILGENERTSQELKVSEGYKNIFKNIKDYIVKENETINDSTLNQEVEILDILSK